MSNANVPDELVMSFAVSEAIVLMVIARLQRALILFLTTGDIEMSRKLFKLTSTARLLADMMLVA